MEREESNQQRTSTKPPEPELVLQWGKRLRCVRVKNPNFSGKSSGGFRRKITSRIVSDSSSDPSFSPINRLPRGSEYSGKSGSPEKEERYYTTRGTAAAGDDSGRLNMEGNGGCSGGGGGGGGCGGGEEKGKFVLPKLYISLSSKEKEEDFLAMKGCKLPQRPKKRAKLIQRTLLLVSPGAWLSDMCQERYEVREKKAPKKRPRGLKAMGNTGSDSE